MIAASTIIDEWMPVKYFSILIDTGAKSMILEYHTRQTTIDKYQVLEYDTRVFIYYQILFDTQNQDRATSTAPCVPVRDTTRINTCSSVRNEDDRSVM